MTWTEVLRQLASALIALLPVIVGGLIGLAGGIIGPAYVQRLQNEAEKKRRRVEKFEELVSALHSYDHWMDSQRDHRLFNGPQPMEVSPLTKAEAISTVYFPSLSGDLLALNVEGRKYEMWMLATRKRKLEDPSTDVKIGHNEAYESYATERTELFSRLKEYARREFN